MATEDPEAGGAASTERRAVSKLYEFKEQLLLLSTLVATVTYVAGLNLPGGSWEQDDPGGHMAGDPILRHTHYRRYLAFYYCNATALAASLVVSLILIILEEKHIVWTVVLRMVMMLDLLSLMGAYGAGSCRDAFTTIFAVVVFSFLVLVIISVLFYLLPHRNDEGDSITDSKSKPMSTPASNSVSKSSSFVGAVKQIQKQNSVVASLVDAKKQEKEKIDVLMLLATFAVTITYVAGLSPPSGFWSSTQDGHRLSDPVLQARGRYRAFFICNTTSFAVSLLIIVLLLEKKLLKKHVSKNFTVRFTVPYVLIAVALLGLMVAYAAGSCREADNTIFVLTIAAAAALCTSTSTDIQLHLQNTRYLVMLLATLVVSITYQAGLDPPGGLWLDSRDGHTIGHPVLQTTHPTRYQVFFYSNSAAFVTSLVVIMMLQSKYLLTRHTLEATLVLDLFGLITAYGAGSTRDVHASFYIIALAGIVLVYVIVHITIIDHAPEPEGGDAAVKDLDDKRKVLLLVAILAATLTYQAGLTPPGGFWLADDQELGRREGFPVLLGNYPPRYHAFFYCNAASFMASVTIILLLINPELYRPATSSNNSRSSKEKERLEYLMVLGILGASMTYQTGLKPPGGLWQDSMNGHLAGNPILHDTNKHRYNAFFYGNSTSFMASIVVVVMLLPLTFREHNLPLWPMHSAILLDMLSLLVAYAAGSTREWETSRNVIFLVIPVLLYIAVYVIASVFYNRKDPVESPTPTPAPSARVTATPYQEAQ
nr:putative PGG domain-containing protein [Triticum timopheevii subsp. timopheevii]